MDTLLVFEFDDTVPTGIVIKNPPALPVEGEVISFRWADYIDDPERLAEIMDADGGRGFRANIISRTFTKDYMEVVVALIEEDLYFYYMQEDEELRKATVQRVEAQMKAHGNY